MKIGILGSGILGATLADGFLKHGDEVMCGSRDPQKLGDWKARAGVGAHTGTFEETARFGELVVLAVKGTAAEACVAQCASALDGKVVLDATNPIAEKPPTNGVLSLFTSFDESLMERLQRTAPRARFVKCFNSVGARVMIHPKLPSRPSMFICGNDSAAKEQAKTILDRFGWETEDMGAIEAARAIEPLVVLWCIPGFAKNDWVHAFNVLR